MKRLPLLGFVLALASCTPTLGNEDQTVACYDTGHGMKCVPLAELPSSTTAMCIDKEGEAKNSASSASGPSASDNDTSQSSDSPNLVRPGGDDDDDKDDHPSSAEDPSGASDSAAHDCATGADTDGDGISDSKDCGCLDPDVPPGTPPGQPGPIIN